ncbi:MAG: hypothetical protein HDR09_20030 [Lachnospiraceae bacterium]|nr:hypothetical protein [Lachnospiraceae bacterium]MBD5505965.1 hypothetical protein [Lachnospiraceae bacterium]
MAESYSFFNSKDHDRVYNARHWADYFYPLFRSGVFNGNLQVVENGGMRVKISDGYAWIDGYLYHLTGGLILDLETASGNMNRIDNIVIRLDLTNRWVRGFVVSGSYYSGKASPPERTFTSTIHELVIARINVPAGATQITQDMIEDTRMNNDLCGWVVGTVKEIDYSQIYAQFTAYQNKKVKEVDEWQALEEAALSTWVTLLKKEKTEQLQKLITDFENIKDNAKTEFEDWFTGNTNNWEDEWTTWFNNLKEQLTDNAVTNLQSQIGILGNLKTTKKSDLVAAINEVKDSSGVTGVKGNKESAYRKGSVNLTPANIGALPDETVPVSKGGTGQTTAVNAANALINALSTGSDAPKDNDYFISQYVNGGTTTTTYHRRPLSKLWEYIKSKINAATDIKATQDSNGNVIKDTYAPKDSVLKLVETGEFTNDTLSLSLKFDATYMLVTREITISTGKVYGYRARIYATPKESAGAATVPVAANAAASTNAGVTLGTSAGGTLINWYGITLKATATYRVSYALYEFNNSYGDYYELAGVHN